MKPCFLLTAMITLTATVAAADSFTIIRDGREYTCQSRDSQPGSPGGAADCATKAYSGPFSRDESMRLCSGARDVGPALCAIKAYSGPFSRAEALTLCERTGTEATAECAIKAYSGPYSREEALRLCRSNAPLLLRAFNLMEKSADVQMQIRQMKAQEH